MAGGAPEGGKRITGINITPLVDIVLVLLIIFMATAHIIAQRSLPLSLPKVSHSQPMRTRDVRVTVEADRTLRLNDLKVSPRELAESLGRLARLGPGLRVTVGADERASWGDVAGVLDTIRGAGITSVATEVEAKGAS